LPPPTAISLQYGAGPYSSKIKKLEGDIKEIAKKVNEVSGIKESDTGLAHPSRWDLVSDKQAQQEEHPLQVSGEGREWQLLWRHANSQWWWMPGQRDGCRAGTCTVACTSQPRNLLLNMRCLPARLSACQVARCTKIISPNTEDAKYVINIKQIAKFVVGLGDKVSCRRVGRLWVLAGCEGVCGLQGCDWGWLAVWPCPAGQHALRQCGRLCWTPTHSLH
jgi:hypothetical protein